MVPAELGFSTPLILGALALLPVIWLLLRALPQAPRRLAFPGYFFLRQIKNTQETPSRTPWYILLLRLLILAAIIIALAGPFLNAPERLARTGPVLIVLDDSWAAADKWAQRRNTLAGIASEVDGTGRQIWLLRTTPQSTARKGEALVGPLSADQLADISDSVEPVARAAARSTILRDTAPALAALGEGVDIRWLSDGVFTGPDIDERQFLRRLDDYGTLTAYVPQTLPTVLTGITYRSDSLLATIRQPQAAVAEMPGQISILARDGRLIEQTPFLMAQGANEAEVEIDLPLTLRNEIGQIRLDGVRSAGAVQLADASTRRAQVGLAGSADGTSGTLLDSRFYLQQALSPYALFRTGTVNTLASSDATVIILDDIGRLREGDAEALSGWIEEGGVLIRFSGPVLADASQDASVNFEASLLPVPLRGGGRAFGGALTWEKPQSLGGFGEDSPFSDLVPDQEIEIRRQVLARPGADTSTRSWAWLEDGAPLVTARAQGKGLIVLFHVTAAPDWSDLPISGLFVDMLRRLTALSVTETGRRDPEQTFVPRRVLNGFGQLQPAPDDARPVSAASANGVASALIPAGLYGDPDMPLAVNVLSNDSKLQSLEAIGAFDGIAVRSYAGQDVRQLAVWFLLLALVLFLIDTVLMLHLNGKLMPLRRQGLAVMSLLVLGTLLALPVSEAAAQIRPPIDPKAADAALYTRFAYVVTGDREADELSRAGLFGLSQRLRERTALEPAAPVGISPDTDELSVYPLIYWPILPGAPVPSETALTRLEAYMARGGLIIFDTRDGDRNFGSQRTEEAAALRRILEQLNMPPLEPVPTGHVLRRSFYLLDDFPGRNSDGPVWVEARGVTGNVNDGVTPVIISGRDWASAWAIDDGGRPLRAMGGAGLAAREAAYRTGINIAMVALTGNYKVDQLQAEALLDQLGEEQR
ncbi:DUF4159 domain-containing protein [Parvularcula sp. IMCC14364]|uniref:DUF4159 domain-containing protein n=1 Tax=Parvularcula sp. IMCC14364 TaxID=3067902 RepID=UPI002741EA56|nr:DUF4159 domain-containing protein [Parvularcula sp. IMCC14364]